MMQGASARESGGAKKSRLCTHLRPFDALNTAFLIFLSVLVVFFANRIPGWGLLLSANIIGGAGILTLSATRTNTRYSLLNVFRDWYIVPFTFLVFKEVYLIIQGLHRNDFDYILIALDRKIFGGDPTVWIGQYAIPLFTEILQIAYASYFIIMIGVGVQLYLRKERTDFDRYIFALMFGFFLSYVGYLLVPAIGPRFTLHDFSALDNELPGVFLAGPIRDFLNAGESIPRNIADPWKYAQRDVFPSGHTAMTLIALFYAAKFKLSGRWCYYVAGTLLVIATVYLRYHYVVDLFGGVVTMMIAVWLAPKLIAWWDMNRECAVKEGS